MIKLSKRLRAVASMVSDGSYLADIGTDHGYIPIYLTKKGTVCHAIAMDVNKGPLLRAQEHIKKEGLNAYIETRLSDGLKSLTEGEADSIVIAGMGGALILRILTDSSALLQSFSEIILQPQSEVEEVRRYLSANGFGIVQEDMVEEDGKYYPMMRCVPGRYDESDDTEEMTTADYRYGALLLKKAHPVLKEFLQKEETQLGVILASLDAQEETEAIIARRAEVKKKRAVIRKAWEKMGAV